MLRRILFLFCVLCLFAACKTKSKAGSVRIDVLNEGEYLRPAISVPLPEDAGAMGKKELQPFGATLLTLHRVYGNGDVARLAVTSRYSIIDNRLVMHPAATLGRNILFEVRWYHSSGLTTLRFQTPEVIPTNETIPKLLTIYPLASEIPDNILMFYAVFDKPVVIGLDTMDFIDILDAEGRIMEQVWSSYLMPEVLTEEHVVPLLLHPGRVKRGVTLREIFGPVHNSGNSYTLHLRREGFKDPYYRELQEDYYKRYRCIDPDYALPEFLQEHTEAELPQAGSRDALYLYFSEAMDYGSMLKGVFIFDAQENPVLVQVRHYLDDSTWQYIPENAWKHGMRYTVELTGEVRDLAHNSLYNPFERLPEQERIPDSKYWSFIPRSR